MYAPSKTFNLAGLVGSYHVIYNDRLRHLVRKAGSVSHYNNGNVLSMHALMAGYSCEGALWVEELRQVIRENVDFACDFIGENFPGVTLSRPQGTYMLFLDCTEWCRSHGVTIDEVIRRGWDVGVIWQDGRPFHGPCHIRMNLALPTARVEEAFRRLKEYVFV
jgi:cystathionine beta-lyase